ncbi:SusC/RagA family TonB-linked outer membrane protein [Niabella beijingensis]|uniref:SusC/RagA family TonB-linked outer membrane protein n=1 Tax=Niabella beijingensis TaxID=2872700 RepID=UPI001CBE3F76|nr:TonB-dependent receptor [Niabella beijingensis]MBZ4189901.1 TonB-dependent receptor [Niabella beijingensis]
MRFKSYLVIVLSLCWNLLSAQNGRVIKGVVLDSATSDPVPGVSVSIAGSSQGTTTNTSGEFSLRAPETARLLFSHVAYAEQSLAVSDMRNGVIRLVSTVAGLNDVVVVAYGSQKKVSVTGAISTVTTDQLRQSSAASVANALAGRLSGLAVMQSGGGQPGRDDAIMYLRGAATTNNNSPLILIDGVPRDNIRTLDPNEVASITVLKDASSTAVFGVRGANGVILITTRRGSEARTQFNASVDQSYTSFTREPERLHSVDYLRLRNEASANDDIAIPYTQADIDKYANPLAGLDPNDPDYAGKARVLQYIYPDHDYYRELISRYTPQTRVNLSASGGTSKINYFVNGTFLHQGGNLNVEPKSVLGYDPSAWMDRYSFRANLDYKVSASFKTFLNIGSYIEKVNMPAAWIYPNNDTHWMMRDLLYQAQTILPITPGPTTIEGFGVAPGQVVYPDYLDRSAFEIMNRVGYRKEVRSNLNSSLGAEWDLSRLVTKGLTLKGMISYDSKATTAMQANKSERLYLALVNRETDELSYATNRPDESMLSLTRGADSRYNINLQGSVNYSRSFDKHAITGMLLAQRDNWESTAADLPYNVIGFSGRFSYGYDNRYLAEVNMGYNGSEQFSPKKRFGFFPAGSAGWVVSNERFFKPLANVVHYLKFRASYGKVGNDQISSRRFIYIDDITMGGGVLGSLGQKVNIGLLGNPDITWETSVKRNIGVDIGLFRDFTINLDFFNEHRKDILIARGTVPTLQGVPIGNLPKVNMGEISNKGFEAELSYNRTFSKDLSLMVKGNYSYNHNTVEFMDEPRRDDSYPYPYRTTGYSLGQQWGYKVDYTNGNGYFNSKQELDEYLAKIQYGFGTPRVGDLKYVDLNHDGVIDAKDQAPIGYSGIAPRISYGLQFSLRYKNFELSPFFQGVAKYSGTYAEQGVYESIKLGTYFGYQRTAWTAERYANGDKITYPALSTHTTTNHTANDFFIMDRSFVRLKNIELAYTLPPGALKRLTVQGLRIYVSAYNYFTWDKLRMQHLDPESDDALGYPITRSLNFGASITF